APFVVHAGSCVWRLLSSSVAMRRRGGEGVRTPSLFSCGCGAPRVTALSWAPCPIEGGMAGNFGAASWMDEGSLPLVTGVVGARSVCVVWWPRVLAISLGL
ncbi:surface protease GP63, partial [Trypanosoma cruzi]